MDRFSKQLRDGIKLDGYSVYLSIDNSKLCMEVTDGDHDRSWSFDTENTVKLLDAVGGIDGLLVIFPNSESEMGNTDKFISVLESICEKHNLKYDYSSWMSNSAHEGR